MLNQYRGYTAHIEFDEIDQIWVGCVVGIKDGVNFHGYTVDAVEQAFKESVDDYFAAFEKVGQKPEKNRV